ncbi:MAG TPA: two-component sensor histidine kinase [Cyanobacteria bacterium UBA8803]|nr:two-component sensor histidine kinase [Cyanobacteria bacterium UBA9273]HBL59936.1 two-component sensor histidine kinase [Cyanobacteria bacterium UBA8803]
MKLHSFRLRVALLLVFLAGSALVGFGVASWLLIYETKVARLDAEIKSQLLQQAVRPHPLNHWPSYETGLRFIFRPAAQTSIALLVNSADGQTLHRSHSWPPQLDLTKLWPSQFNLNSQPLPPLRQLPPTLEQAPPPPRDLPPAGNWMPPEPPLEEPPFLGNPPDRLVKVVTKRLDQQAWRVGLIASPHVRMAIAISFSEIDREMSAIRNIFLIAVPVVLILVAIGAWALSGSALQPIHEVTARIRRVTAKGLDQRIPIGATDSEFIEMLQVFNQMMERLERSFHQASRFSADAAHELKTPLAILQGELERTLQQADPGSPLQQNLSNLLDEVRRLSAIIRKLLLLSLADAGQMRLHKIEVDLSPVLADLAEDMEMLAPHLELQLKIAPELRVQADRDLLIQVLHNLISNAIKYNLPEGWVQIHACRQATTVSVTVSNTSPDIPASERERIFDRFHRGDRARNRQVEGLGLGLSLAREIARAHSGELKLDPTPIGQTAFTLILPASRQC